MVKNCQGDLGKQRLFGVIGQAVFVLMFLVALQYLQTQHFSVLIPGDDWWLTPRLEFTDQR